MNEELLKILKKAMEIAEATGDFVLEQSPLLLQEFFLWHFWMNAMMATIFFVAGLISLTIGFRVAKSSGEYFETPIPIIAHIVTGVLAIATFAKIYNVVFVLVAPKLYLIDYLLKPTGCN